MKDDEKTFFEKIRAKKSENEIKEIYNTSKASYIKQLKEYVEKLTKLQGTLPKDNAGVSNQYLAEFVKDYGKVHIFSLSEMEAYSKQYFAAKEYGKFLK